MSNWIWSVVADNWEIVKEKKIWAVKNELKTRRVKKGDKIIFYVKRSGSFQGIYKVTSSWQDAKESHWKDEENGEIKYPFECKLEEVQSGDAVFNELMSKLDFVKGRTNPHFTLQSHSTGPGNYGHEITKHDYELILNEMKEGPEQTQVEELTDEHEDIIAKLQEIGSSLGFEPSTDKEETHIAKGCIVDLVWTVKIASIGMIKYVFEVQSKGSRKSLITNLLQSINNPMVKKVIAVSDKKQLEQIKDQITQMRAVSESSKQMFVYLDMKKVNKTYDLLPTLQDFKSDLQLI